MLSGIESGELFYHYPVLAELSLPLQQLIQQEGISFQAGPGQTLYEAGDPCNWFIMLTKGTMRVSRATPGGRNVALYEMNAGESCLMTVSALLGGLPYMAQGTISRSAKGVMFSHYLFSRILSDSDAFRGHIFYLCSQRVNQLVHRFDQLDTLFNEHNLDTGYYDQPQHNSGRIDL